MLGLLRLWWISVCTPTSTGSALVTCASNGDSSSWEATLYLDSACVTTAFTAISGAGTGCVSGHAVGTDTLSVEIVCPNAANPRHGDSVSRGVIGVVLAVTTALLTATFAL